MGRLGSNGLVYSYGVGAIAGRALIPAW